MLIVRISNICPSFGFSQSGLLFYFEMMCDCYSLDDVLRVDWWQNSNLTSPTKCPTFNALHLFKTVICVEAIDLDFWQRIW